MWYIFRFCGILKIIHSREVTIMADDTLSAAIYTLAEQFIKFERRYVDITVGDRNEKQLCWMGDSEEEIMICVHKGTDIHEMFHRQDCFFFNFAYKGDYGAISYQYDNHITVHEGECYIGQPFTGYALYGHSDEDIIIVGVLIQKETFFRTFLPMISTDDRLFRFFLAPQTDQYSDEFIHLRFCNDEPIRALLEMMIIEYANHWSNRENIIKSLVLTLFMHVVRHYTAENPSPVLKRPSDQIFQYIAEHLEAVTLKDLSKRFSYHPSYISTLLRRELGKSFSEILLEQRMARAVILLKGTTLPISEIAAMLGYSNSSNFFKAFREYYHMPPREYLQGIV